MHIFSAPEGSALGVHVKVETLHATSLRLIDATQSATIVHIKLNRMSRHT